MKRIKQWIEAIRLHTLPISIAGVLAGDACALYFHSFKWLPATICLLFAILAQTTSNLANEYYDYKNGLDKPGRAGFRRGVTEGDISPLAMRNATFGTLLAACLVGLSLIYWGGWWLLAIGFLIAIFALAYSAGPWPLSQHGLGDVAVFIFYGIVPVSLTAWLQTGTWDMWPQTPAIAMAIGFMSINVLIVNNYRDYDDDKKVDKHTTVVIFGRRTMAAFYLADVVAAAALIFAALCYLNPISWLIPLLYLIIGVQLYYLLTHREGGDLNRVLKFTALSILLTSMLLILTFLLI